MHEGQREPAGKPGRSGALHDFGCLTSRNGHRATTKNKSVDGARLLLYSSCELELELELGGKDRKGDKYVVSYFRRVQVRRARMMAPRRIELP